MTDINRSKEDKNTPQVAARLVVVETEYGPYESWAAFPLKTKPIRSRGSQTPEEKEKEDELDRKVEEQMIATWDVIDDVTKAHPHKYIKREGTPGNYKYFYADDTMNISDKVFGIPVVFSDKMKNYDKAVMFSKKLVATIGDYLPLRFKDQLTVKKVNVTVRKVAAGTKGRVGGTYKDGVVTLIFGQPDLDEWDILGEDFFKEFTTMDLLHEMVHNLYHGENGIAENKEFLDEYERAVTSGLGFASAQGFNTYKRFSGRAAFGASIRLSEDIPHAFEYAWYNPEEFRKVKPHIYAILNKYGYLREPISGYSDEAKRVGKGLTKEAAVNVWKERQAIPEHPKTVEEANRRAFLREEVENYLGFTEKESLTDEQIEEKLGISLENTKIPSEYIPEKVYVGLHGDWYEGWEGWEGKPVKTFGLKTGVHANFGASPRPDSVYVAATPEFAQTYANLYHNPLVLEIDVSKLDKSKFYYDPLDVPSDGKPNQMAYRGDIPAEAIRVNNRVENAEFFKSLPTYFDNSAVHIDGISRGPLPDIVKSRVTGHYATIHGKRVWVPEYSTRTMKRSPGGSISYYHKETSGDKILNALKSLLKNIGILKSKGILTDEQRKHIHRELKRIEPQIKLIRKRRTLSQITETLSQIYNELGEQRKHEKLDINVIRMTPEEREIAEVILGKKKFEKAETEVKQHQRRTKRGYSTVRRHQRGYLPASVHPGGAMDELARIMARAEVEKRLEESKDKPEVKKALQVAEEVKKAGGRALFVGGAVRDMIMGIPSKDIDVEIYGISKEELSETLKQIGKVDEVGASFGVFKVKDETMPDPIDVSLPRRDSLIGVGHKGFAVEVDQNMDIQEAARRRDLSINSVAYDPLTNELLDPFNGVADIKNKILRATDPKHFIEDPLRVYRVMQFAGRFGFAPDEELIRISNAIDLSSLPKERVFTEFEKLLLKSPKPSDGLKYIKDLGITKIFPEFADLMGQEQNKKFHPEGDAWEHTLQVVDRAREISRIFEGKDKMVFMLAALLHDIGKFGTTKYSEDWELISPKHSVVGAEIAGKILERLTDDLYYAPKVQQLIKDHMIVYPLFQDKVPDSAIRRLARRVSIPMLVALSIADKRGRDDPLRSVEEEDWLLKRFKELGLENPEALKPIVMGRHLIPLGVKPGKEMGQILDALYEGQMDGKFTSAEEGIKYARAKGLIKSFVIMKARPHKYIRRTGMKGNYQYFYRQETNPKLRNAIDGMIHDMDYWYKNGGWDAYVNFWTRYDPDTTAEGIKEGKTKDAIADTISENAAQTYQANTMKEFGISEEEVWKLVHNAVWGEGGFEKEQTLVDEPWRMTVRDFIDSRSTGPFALDVIEAGTIHKEDVREALKNGKQVPKEVLKDYPDLEEKENYGKLPKFIQPSRAKKSRELVVWVDVDKFDEEWKRTNPETYIGKGGTGHTISNRYGRFQEFLKTGEAVEMPEVGLTPEDLGIPIRLGFTNGRHRFAVLRDMGLKSIPVSVDRKQFEKMSLLFGGEEPRKLIIKGEPRFVPLRKPQLSDLQKSFLDNVIRKFQFRKYIFPDIKVPAPGMILKEKG